ncbi:MAG: DMT family transporter [Casimicrobiaceae bacterium]
MTGSRGHPVTVLKLAMVALIWGGTFIAGRVVTAEMASPQAALWRYVVASGALLVALAVLERRWPGLSGRQVVGVLLLGATGVFAYNLCFMAGLKTVTASRGALIIALNPAMTALGAAVFFGDRLSPARIAGIVVALTGATVVISHGDVRALVDGALGTGELLLFGCVASWVAYTLIGKRMLRRLSPLAASTYAAWAGTVMLALAALVSGDGIAPPQASLTAWAAIAFLGVLGTAVAFVWYYEGVHAIGPAAAAVFINLVPVSAVVLGVLLLDERLDAATLLGGALVVAGVAILNRGGGGPAPAQPKRDGIGEAPCA